MVEGVVTIDVPVAPVLHTYVLAPVAVNVIDSPLHIVVPVTLFTAPDKVSTGSGFTVTVTLCVVVHPAVLVRLI